MTVRPNVHKQIDSLTEGQLINRQFERQSNDTGKVGEIQGLSTSSQDSNAFNVKFN